MRCKNCGWANPANNAKCEKCNALLSGQIGGKAANDASEKNDLKKTAKGCPECGYPVRDIEKGCPHCGCVVAIAKQEPAPQQEAAPLQEPSPKQETPPQHEPPPPPKPSSRQEPPPPPPKQTPAIPEPAGQVCAFCKCENPETAHYCSNCGVSLTNERLYSDATMNPWVRAEQMQMPQCSLSFITEDNDPSNHAALHFAGNVIQLNRGNTDPANQTITSKTQAELIFENDRWYLQDKSALKTTYIYAGDKVELKSGDIIMLGNRLFQFDCVSGKQTD